MEFLTAVVWFAIGFFFSWYTSKPTKLPYRWECNRPECEFKCSSSNVDMLMRVIDKHIEVSHDG